MIRNLKIRRQQQFHFFNKMKIVVICVFLLLGGIATVSAVPITGNGSNAMSQQNQKVTGRVVDKNGEPVIGANVIQQGTSNGTLTNGDGNFTLNLPGDATLVVSSIGYTSQQIAVGSRSLINVTLEEDTKQLDEVIVVGYGTMKKKLVTGATVQVSGDNLQKLSTTSAFTALQSQTPGVNILQNSGQPGEGFKVNIRGIGTMGNSAPLYVIDGVAGGNLQNLNNADIESIDILKDAASAAIYGARAANGVILVTTKQGKAGKLQVSYDGYYGVQNVYKMPSLLNAKQYMAIQDEVNFNEGLALNDWKTILGKNYDNAVYNGTYGTNWLDEARNVNAPTQNHAVNIVGGNDISKFSMGLSYTAQEGIIGKPVASDYNRTTARMNSDHVLWNNKSFDVIKIGETLTFAYSTKQGIGIGNQYWNDISNFLRAMPIMPLYGEDGAYFRNIGETLTSYESMMSNPIAGMVYNRGQNMSKNYNLDASANIQIQPIKNLIFKSQFGYKMSASSYRQYQPDYANDKALSISDQRQVALAQQSASSGWQYTLENTLNYKFGLNLNHFDALVGQSVEKWGMGESVSATNGHLLFSDFEHAYIDNSQGIESGITKVSGSPWGEGALASFFGRVNYDYNETYLATFIMRADGSSNFARGHRWGYFPSASLGWVITNENFMQSTKGWLDYLKLRGSYGENGNQSIAAFQYLAGVSFDAKAAYSFGNAKDSQTTGGYAYIQPNPDVSWETSIQKNIGLDARMLNSRLSVTIDAYDKFTKNWLLQPPGLGTIGTGVPYKNGGDIDNKGIEVALGWNDRIGKDFTYGINLNGAYNHNEVTRIANTEKVIHGTTNVLSQGTGEMYRAQVGFPIGYFYGYHTSGIFQNQAEIDAWKAAGNGILQTKVQPGDVKFTDMNQDGVIDENDKGLIGDPNPDFTAGGAINLGYKGFDFNVTLYGAFGQQIAKSYRKFGDGRHENYTTEVYERWHGEGTSNKWPRLTAGTNANYMNISDLFIENADFVKIQNLTIGYDFKKLFKNLPMSQARLYFTAQNLFTFTGYSGMDPEIGYSPQDTDGTTQNWAKGIDLGFYPQPRTYLVGVNLKF